MRVPSFKNLAHRGVQIFNKPPTLFSQKSVIATFKIPKSQTTPQFRSTQVQPVHPMKPLPPPTFPHQNLVTMLLCGIIFLVLLLIKGGQINIYLIYILFRLRYIVRLKFVNIFGNKKIPICKF